VAPLGGLTRLIRRRLANDGKHVLAHRDPRLDASDTGRRLDASDTSTRLDASDTGTRLDASETGKADEAKGVTAARMRPWFPAIDDPSIANLPLSRRAPASC
jgi:hypothetical protein